MGRPYQQTRGIRAVSPDKASGSGKKRGAVSGTCPRCTWFPESWPRTLWERRPPGMGLGALSAATTGRSSVR